MGFWQFSWNFVNDEVMGFLGSSMSGSFEKGLNATFFVLIPKKRGVEDLRDFRPISLVRGV